MDNTNYTTEHRKCQHLMSEERHEIEVRLKDEWSIYRIARLCSEFSVNARFHDKTVHILRSSEPEAEAEPPPMAARSVLDRLA